MSRILRRPMFRGGRVDGRGTGITSGLGYEKGGRVPLESGGDFLSTQAIIDLIQEGKSTPELFEMLIDRGYGGVQKVGEMAYSFNPEPKFYGDQPRAEPKFYGDQPNFANGGIASLANGGMPGKRGLVDGPGGYAGIGTGGFYDSILGQGLRSVKDYVGKPLLNFINQDIANPILSLVGYGDAIPRMETPLDDKYLLGLDENYDKIPSDEYVRFSDRYQNKGKGPIETDSEAIPKAIRQNQDKILEEELLKNFKKKNNNNNNNNNEPSTDDLMGIDKEKFAKLLGSKEARGEDISNMLLSFAGKALKPEATVKGAFGEFFDEEAKRPSSKTKIDQAAAQLAINKYIKGEISKAEMEKLVMLNRTKISDQIELQKAALTLDTALQAGVKNGVGSSKKSIAVIQSAVEQVYGDNFNFGGPLPETAEEINVSTIYVKDNEQSSEAKDLVYIDPTTGNLKILKTIF